MDNEKFIFFASSSNAPDAKLFDTLSEPARSTKFSTPRFSESFGYFYTTSIMQME
jgi:hypothetical protein